MPGEVTSLELPDVTVHIYTAPSDHYLINSLVFELADELLAVDGQMFVPDAEALADLIDGLGKPLRRFVLSHNHPDHYLGFEVMTRRFPGVPIAALPLATRYVAALGPLVVAARKAEMGDLVASTAIVPDTELRPGAETIGGVRFVFEAFEDAEAESQVVIHLPDQRATAVFDLACRAEHHCFTVRPAFDHWTEILRTLQEETREVDHLILGHGAPTDPSALAATIEYVQAAKEVHAVATDHEDFAARMKERFPDRGETMWLDLSAMLLYGVIYP